ncbi:MAG: biotin--[acetyl-CoA-carboxylase] ligase [Saprospirales bacterium]|nr:biotin--[acetyl-CoA-carboxylase] ligase [Saprospirales bacterium]
MSNLNTHFVGKVLLPFEELDSTQTYAQNLLSRSRPAEGTLVTASSQSSGKGLLHNRWESAPGQNLLLSLILYPDFLPLSRAFLLSQAMALGVRDWAHRYAGARARVKWPNDLYIGDKKVGGILIQNAVSDKHIGHSVVGIGINVNQTVFPPELPNPGSIKGETGLELDLKTALNELCECLEQRYLDLREGAWLAIQEEYLRQLYGFGETRTFLRPDGEPFSGKITGVLENGYLQLQTDKGLESFEVKEIQLKPI